MAPNSLSLAHLLPFLNQMVSGLESLLKIGICPSMEMEDVYFSFQRQFRIVLTRWWRYDREGRVLGQITSMDRAKAYRKLHNVVLKACNDPEVVERSLHELTMHPIVSIVEEGITESHMDLGPYLVNVTDAWHKPFQLVDVSCKICIPLSRRTADGKVFVELRPTIQLVEQYIRRDTSSRDNTNDLATLSRLMRQHEAGVKKIPHAEWKVLLKNGLNNGKDLLKSASLPDPTSDSLTVETTFTIPSLRGSNLVNATQCQQELGYRILIKTEKLSRFDVQQVVGSRYAGIYVPFQHIKDVLGSDITMTFTPELQRDDFHGIGARVSTMINSEVLALLVTSSEGFMKLATVERELYLVNFDPFSDKGSHLTKGLKGVPRKEAIAICKKCQLEDGKRALEYIRKCGLDSSTDLEEL